MQLWEMLCCCLVWHNENKDLNLSSEMHFVKWINTTSRGLSHIHTGSWSVWWGLKYCHLITIWWWVGSNDRRLTDRPSSIEKNNKSLWKNWHTFQFYLQMFNQNRLFKSSVTEREAESCSQKKRLQGGFSSDHAAYSCLHFYVGEPGRAFSAVLKWNVAIDNMQEW